MTYRSIKKGPMGVARVIINLFSSSTGGERSPPTKNKILHLRLITIAASHYCEKARWGLDLLEEDEESPYYYTEDGHPPGFHAFQTVPATRDGGSATPLVVLPDGRCLMRSDVILRELCPFLYPSEIREKVAALERDMGGRLGAASRLYGYHCLLNPSREYYPAIAEHLCLNTCKVERKLFAAILDKGIDEALCELMKINDENAAACKDVLLQVFQEVSDRLEANGGEYIMDAPDKKYGFTAADLTFAALAYPYMWPPELSRFYIDPSRLPPDYVEVAKQLQATRAGQHVLRMYAQHRPVAADGKVAMKTVDRDRVPWKELLLLLLAGGTAAAASVIVIIGRLRRR
jgi:glutathione S-transferase